jgi:acyl carrier protein
MNPIVKVIIDTLVAKFQVSPDGVTADSPFASLALDSLVLIELGAILSNRFGVKINGGELLEEHTIGKIAALIEAKRVRSDSKVG